LTKELTKAQECQQLIVRAESTIAPACTGDLTWDRLKAAFGVALMREPRLAIAKPATVVQSVVTAAQLQLDPSGNGNEACILVFNDRNLGPIAQFLPMYNGLIKLAVRGGNVVNIDVNAVYTTDEFEYEHGTMPRILHRPDIESTRTTNQMVAVYAVAHFRDAQIPMPEVMGMTRLRQILESSRQRNRWTSSDNLWEEWCRKTVIRRLCKRLPQNADLRRALDIVADVEGKEVPTEVVDKGEHLDSLLGIGDARAEPKDEDLNKEEDLDVDF
jgi:recombination protein RecT